MLRTSYLIADSDKYGKDQIISGTIKYVWDGCMVADEIEAYNERVISAALQFAKENHYTNIREVVSCYKEVFYKKWGLVDKKKVREIIRLFRHDNF